MKLNDIKDIAIVGSGVIGYSWALSFAMNGHPVHVYDINDESLKLAKERIHESLVNLAQNKVINPNKIEKIDNLEDDIADINPAILRFLLKDKTTRKNTLWYTKDYESYGSDYDEHSEIKLKLTTGKTYNVIQL